MKNIFKKAISLIVLASFLIVSAVPVSAAVITAQDATKVIEALDIADYVDYPYFKKSYTRIEFAKMLCKMDIEYPLAASMPDYVKDVSGVNADYARFVVGKGYMDLDYNGNFNPDGGIAYSVAVKALAAVAGYSLVADIEGGTDASYMLFAQRAGIVKGVKIQDTTKLSREELAMLILNTLDAAPVDLNVSGVQMNTGNLLAKRDIYKYEGTLLATSTRAIGASLARAGTVNIDGNVFNIETEVSGSLVGKRVVYYLRETNESNTIVCIVDATGGTTLKLYAKDIYDYKFSGSEIIISYDDNKKVRVPFSATVLVNGKPGDLTPAFMSSFDAGQLEIFDADGDGAIDTVYAISCINDIAISASGDTHIIKLEHATIDYDNIEKNVVFYENGKTTTVNAIKNGSVVSVAADAYTTSVVAGVTRYDYSTATRMEIFISNKKAVGTLDSTSYNSYSIGGRSYNISDYLTNVAIPENDPLIIGSPYIFYVDYYGLICDYEFDPNADGMKYGYFVKAGMTTGLNGSLQVRMLTQEGNVETFDVTESYKLNGDMTENDDSTVLSSPLDMRQVIRYRLKDGLIAEIDTDPLKDVVSKKLANGVPGNFDYTSPSSTAVFGTGETPENSLTTDWGRTYTTQTYRGNMNGFDSFKTMVTNKTVVFSVPDPYDSSNVYIPNVDEKSLFAGDINTFASSTSYDISSYDIGDCGEAGCIVWYGGSTSAVDRFRPLNIVEKVVRALDENGSEYYIVTVHGSAGSRDISTVDESLLKFETASGTETTNFMANLDEGDLVRFETNTSNKIVRISFAFDMDVDAPASYDGAGNMLNPMPNSTDTLQIGHYYLRKSTETHFEFTNKADMTDLRVHSFKYARGVPVYNMVDGTFTVYSGNFEELPTFLNNANKVTLVTHLTLYELVSAAVYIWN